MATKTAAKTTNPDLKHQVVRWEAFDTNGDIGTSVSMGAWRDRSVQVLGTFGTGGEITIQGSNDGGTTWATLTDPQGNALTFTSARIEAITELCGLIRPKLTAGTGTIDIDVYIFFGGWQP